MLRKLVWPILAIVFLFLAGQAEASTPVIHVVKQTDTISKIAKKICGEFSDSLVDRIVRENKQVKHKDSIFPGQKIVVVCEVIQPAIAEVHAEITSVRHVSFQSGADSIIPAGKPAVTTMMEAPKFVFRSLQERIQDLLRKTFPLKKRMEYNPERIKWERFACGLAGRHCPLFLSITAAENPWRDCKVRSEFNRNGTFDTGFSSMNSSHINDYDQLDFSDCRDNIIAGVLHISRHGPTRWTKYNNGDYLNYLPFYQKFARDYETEMREGMQRLAFTGE